MNEKNLDTIEKEFFANSKTIDSLESLNHLRIKYLGKKGKLTLMMKGLVTLPIQQRKKLGIQARTLKNEINQILLLKKANLEQQEIDQQLQKEIIDFSLPLHQYTETYVHPLTQMIDKVTTILESMGLEQYEGKEVETPYFNFDALNIPEDHPARMQGDTFYLRPDLLLRTHTSGVQIHTMLKYPPPLMMMSVGRCYRKDEIDATHLPQFHQLEGLLIYEGANFSEMKGFLSTFLQQIFDNSNIKVLLKPDFFPFTEPSAEVSFSCPYCINMTSHSHCKICKNTQFVEVAGCGMVHPQVLKNVGIDSKRYQGYAFGFGIERLAMLKYQISDIRLFYENHPDFLKQF